MLGGIQSVDRWSNTGRDSRVLKAMNDRHITRPGQHVNNMLGNRMVGKGTVMRTQNMLVQKRVWRHDEGTTAEVTLEPMQGSYRRGGPQALRICAADGSA